jgi:hypothetical protein
VRADVKCKVGNMGCLKKIVVKRRVAFPTLGPFNLLPQGKSGVASLLSFSFFQPCEWEKVREKEKMG